MRSGILKIMFGFCVGVATTICLIVPGRIGPTVLIRGDQQLQSRQLNEAGDKVERIGRSAVHGLFQTKTFFKDKLKQW